MNYKHLNKAKENSSDESNEEMELFVKPKPKRKEIPTIEKIIEEGDTLQSLAIKCGCSVCLKTKNNFVSYF